MVLVPSALFLLYFFGKLRIEALKKCLNSEFFFRVISCGLIEVGDFREKYEED